MYVGEPHKVAAIMLVFRWRANPKSAAGRRQSTRTYRCCTDILVITIQITVSEVNTNLDDDSVLRSALAPIGVTQQDVLGFEVSVNDAFGLQDVHGLGDLPQEQADGALAECDVGCGTKGSQYWGEKQLQKLCLHKTNVRFVWRKMGKLTGRSPDWYYYCPLGCSLCKSPASKHKVIINNILCWKTNTAVYFRAAATLPTPACINGVSLYARWLGLQLALNQ